MQTTIKHTRTEINARATNYGSSNGFAAFHFFFFLSKFVYFSYKLLTSRVEYRAYKLRNFTPDPPF